MKSFIFSLLLCIPFCSSAHAQHFNTITNSPSRYKVEVVNPTSKASRDANAREASPQGDTSRTASETADVQLVSDAQKQEWIDRYLSVAYPLRNIKVNSPYGYRTDPITGKRKFHNGIDLQARNEEAYAMFDGVVSKVGQDKTSGKYVVIQHGNFRISYCHLSQILIAKDTPVRPGDIIAITGSTGRSTGPHLHLTCKYKGKAIDPSFILGYVRTIRDECTQFLVTITGCQSYPDTDISHDFTNFAHFE